MNTILIKNQKSNEIEFDVTVEGIPTEDLIVRFLIELPEFTMMFPCTKHEESKWIVNIPPLIQLETSKTYPFKIEAITNGYYFMAEQGTLKVIDKVEVQVELPKDNTTEVVSVEIPTNKEPENLPTIENNKLPTFNLLKETSSKTTKIDYQKEKKVKQLLDDFQTLKIN